MTRMLTVEQAAERLQVTPNTIRTWIKQGRIPGRKIGKVYRIPEDQLNTTLSEEEGFSAVQKVAEAKAKYTPPPREEHPQHKEWRLKTQEERDRILDAVMGMAAGGSRTVDDFLREKHEETEEEERRWEERRKARDSRLKGNEAA